jgi:hypothetical protein
MYHRLRPLELYIFLKKLVGLLGRGKVHRKASTYTVQLNAEKYGIRTDDPVLERSKAIRVLDRAVTGTGRDYFAGVNHDKSVQWRKSLSIIKRLVLKKFCQNFV